MSDREIPLREAREQLGPLVEDANHGRVTIITKYGKPYAALVPLDRIKDTEHVSQNGDSE